MAAGCPHLLLILICSAETEKVLKCSSFFSDRKYIVGLIWRYLPASLDQDWCGKQVPVSVWVLLLCFEEEDAHVLQTLESLGHIQLENQTVYVWSPRAGECSVSCGRGEIFQCCREMLVTCSPELSA